MRIAIRVDSSPTIGAGHFFRCSNLAREFVRRGIEVVFVCNELNYGHAELVHNLGCTLIEISLYENEIADASAFLDAVVPFEPEIVVVDSYKLKVDWESHVRPAVKTLVVIADIPDVRHSCDFLVDQNLTDRTIETWSHVAPNAKVLIGPRYALLDSRLNERRRLKIGETVTNEKILVYFGGTNVVGILTKTVKALESIATNSGPAYVVAHKEQWQDVVRSVSKPVDWCIHQEPNSFFVDLVDNASLAIGAGGSTVWERLCLGVDQILISIARNQEYGCIELNKRNLATYLGDHEKISKEEIRFAIEQRIAAHSVSNTRVMDGQLLVDGFGSHRVVENIIPTPADEISIRRATIKDVALFFVWVNDQYVRSASLNDREVEWDEHLTWFNHKVNSDASKMYVCLAGGLPVGQVRFDFVDDHVELDYSIDSDVRGRDWAKAMLDLALHEFRGHSQEAVLATVRNQNARSISALLKAGYAQVSGDESSAVFLHT